MKKILIFILIPILAAPVLFAAGKKNAPTSPESDKPVQQASPGPAAEESKKPADEPAAAIVLKNKSSFGVDPVTRNPFWPINWKPTGKIASGGGTDEGAVPPGAFLVTSITLGGASRFAIINGKTMWEGQQFGLQVGTRVYHVGVKRIEDGRVILGRQDEEIVVPLRRK